MTPSELVIAAARIGAGARDGRLRPLAAPEQWPQVVELALEHRVATLVWEALSRSPELDPPAPVRDVLSHQLARSTATRMLCESTLTELVSGLRARGLEVIVLKGATVAHTLYPQPELRLYHDLDVLCRVADYPALYQALSAASYTSAGTYDARGTHDTLAVKPSPLESHDVRGFFDPTGDVKVEVHFDAFQLGLLDRSEDQLWAASRMLDLNGVAIRVLAPEHQFLHLAVHAHRHSYTRLSWLIELDLFVRKARDLNWAQVTRVARAEGAGTMLRHALATAHAVLGTPLPQLPPPTLEERCLGLCYRSLWPFAKARALNVHERQRLLHFLPDDADPRHFLYGLALMGRRREKLDALLCRGVPGLQRSAAR